MTRRAVVRERHARIATGAGNGHRSSDGSCHGGTETASTIDETARQFAYSDTDVDVTPETIERACGGAKDGNENAAFRPGGIEHLPVPDDSVDVVVPNRAATRSPGEPLLTADASSRVRADPDSVVDRVAGASTIDGLAQTLAETGFERVDVAPEEGSGEFVRGRDGEHGVSRDRDDGHDVSAFLATASVTKPEPTGTGVVTDE